MAGAGIMSPKPPPSIKAGPSPSPQAIQTLTALLNQGQFAQCEPQARSLTAQFSGHAFGWSILGVCLAQLGRFSEAVEPMQKAVALQPSNAGLHNNLGNILSHLGRPVEAEASFRRALALQPDFVHALNNLGSTLKHMNRLGEAEAAFRRAIKLQPNSAETLNSLGTTLSGLGRFGDAESCFRRALALQPDYAEALSNLGTTLNEQGRADEAETCFRRALALRPDSAYAHNNLGNALRALRRLGEAEICFRRALALMPDLTYAHSNLGTVLIDMGRLEEAEVSLRSALALEPNFADAFSNLLFAMNYRSNTSVAALDEARRYGQRVDAMASKRYTSWLADEHPRHLRVGMVSGDMRNHPVGYFLETVLREINPEKIELIAYSTNPEQDQFTDRLRTHFAAWKPLAGLSDTAAAELIHADGVHILLDLSGHTTHQRLPMFAYKPAPVQASWLGYFATTGVPAMDYLIADPWTLPETEEVYFTEKIWRLPETRLCFTPPNVDVPVAPLPALTNGYVTFGCFNNLTKINDAVVALWSRVLAAVPESRLLLKSRQLKDVSVQQNIVERFAVHGIGADRLILEAPVPRAEYLVAYQRMDIALDPFPYPGGTVSAEGLWMGVPVLTLAGRHFLSRQGVGLLMNTGLPEWIASDPDDYVARAVAHASDLQGLAALRASLRERFLASPICDAKRFARHFEQALEGMWRGRGG